MLDDTSSRLEVLFDVDESGFRIATQTEVDSKRYPQLATMDQGQKLRIAGEIMEVDAAGTGTIRINVQEFFFEENLLKVMWKK